MENLLINKQEGDTLILEWNNRRLPVDWMQTLVLTVVPFMFMWPVILFTHMLIKELVFDDGVKDLLAGEWPLFGSSVFFVVLAGSYLFVILALGLWLRRLSIERVEIGPERYRHRFSIAGWLLSRDWSTGTINRIAYGFKHSPKGRRASITTLSVHRGWRQDMIAYWAPDEYRLLLFRKIKKHLREIDSPIRAHFI